MSNLSVSDQKTTRFEQVAPSGEIFESERVHEDVVDHVHTAAEMREVLLALRSSAMYRRLAACRSSGEGNLLEPNGTTDCDDVAVRKLLVLDRMFRGVRPGTVLETGTNKGFFGLVLHTLCPSYIVELDTFDINAGGADAANILDEVMYTRFTLGDTRDTLRHWNQFAELAWIDGGHLDGVPRNDIEQAMRLKIPCILVDDMDMDAVHADFDLVAAAHPEYTAQSFHDTWPIGILLLTGPKPNS